jgi:glycosyltransferase involved in cell wall biosynthesis
MSLRVNWICELPTHYNDFLFNRIKKDGRIDLNVYYLHRQLQSHPWKSHKRDYKYAFFYNFLGVDWKITLKSAINRKELFIVGGWYNRTMFLIILFRILLNGKYIIWTDTPRLSSKKGVINIFRSWWVKVVLVNAYNVWGTGISAINNLILLGAPKYKTYNLPYFTDSEIFNSREPISKLGELIFLSSGRLNNSHKGFDIAIKALGLLHMRMPNIKFKYLIAGVGDDLHNLINLCKENGIGEFVEFVGWLDINELEKFYKKGHLFLHPARYEPFGVAVIEAMASGLIVFGSDVTGVIIDRIIDGVNGFIHLNEDYEDLYKKINAFLTTSSNYQETLYSNSIAKSNEWTLDKGVNLIYKYLCVE